MPLTEYGRDAVTAGLHAALRRSEARVAGYDPRGRRVTQYVTYRPSQGATIRISHADRVHVARCVVETFDGDMFEMEIGNGVGTIVSRGDVISIPSLQIVVA